MVAVSVALLPLDVARDFEAVEAVYRRASDYLALESGLSPAVAARVFFEERPPGGTEAPLKFGVADGDQALAAIGDLAFGYPEAEDAYLGLLLLVPENRDKGLGQAILGEIKRNARERGARRLLLGVLDANRRARAFWEAQGFKLVRTSGPHVFGERQHVVHRFELQLTGAAGDCA